MITSRQLGFSYPDHPKILLFFLCMKEFVFCLIGSEFRRAAFFFSTTSADWILPVFKVYCQREKI
jgi:hypothetical protein